MFWSEVHITVKDVTTTALLPGPVTEKFLASHLTLNGIPGAQARTQKQIVLPTSLDLRPQTPFWQHFYEKCSPPKP